MRLARLFALTCLACDPAGVEPPCSDDAPQPQQTAAIATHATPAPPVIVPTQRKLVLHEWGTFTAVAGADGTAVNWRPLTGPSDLPAFVYTQARPGIRGTGGSSKGATSGTVRMETPVIYFYVDEPQHVWLSVKFTGGSLTEWFPRVARFAPDELDWGQFLVTPDTPQSRALMPESTAQGHYFAARATDSALVRMCSTAADEYEKFLFYRGVGSFDLSLTVRLVDNNLELRTRDAATIPALVFERRGDRIGFTKGRIGDTTVTLARPTLDDNLPAVLTRLEALLLADGLYPREVSAMLATWQDHWFEDGLRVFYLLPRAEIDALLPLSINPAPTEYVRTIVGRIEVISPQMEASITRELTQPGRDVLARCRVLHERHGRFAEPAVRRIADSAANPNERTAAIDVLAKISSGSCNLVD